MRRVTCCALVVVASFGLASCNDEDYAQIMQDALRETLDAPWEALTWFSYPTDNFGLMTMWSLTGEDAQIGEATFWCDAWACVGVSPPPDDQNGYFVREGLANPGCGGEVALAEEERNEVAVGFVLPKIAEVLQLGAAVDWNRGVTTTISFGEACYRRLSRPALSRFMDGLPPNDPTREQWDIGNLAIVVTDVVVDGLSATVTVDSSLNPSLDAKLTGAVSTVLNQDAELNVSVKKESEGTYSLTIDRPIIAAIFVKKQPAGGVLEGEDEFDWSAWDDVSIAPTFARSGDSEAE